VNITVNAAPTVTLTVPAPGASVFGTNITVNYTLIGSGYDHLRLSLDGNAVLITNPTGSYTFTNVTPGGHTVTAQLEDAQSAVVAGATATVSFTALAPPPNQPPSVDVGADQTLAVGQTLDLQAAVVDDGWPNPPGAVSLNWASQSGPATPTWPLNDANQAHTHVVFPTAGTYVLRLTANDSQFTSFDELTVTVTAPNVAPVVSFTRSPLVGSAPLTVAVNGTGSSDSDGTIVGYGWTFGDGGTASGVTASHVYPTAGTYTITLTVTDNAGATASTTATVNVQGNWWNAAWGARRELTFNTSGISEAQVNFPVLVKLTPANFDYTQVRANGADLRFVDADGVTVLSHEIATFNVGGESLIWVKVPRIEPNSTTDSMTMYLSNPTAPDGQNRTGVWSNGYAGVWHLDGVFTDATANANHGVNQGTSAVTGYLGGARSFNGTSNYIAVANAASLALANTLTLEAWVRPTVVGTYGRIIDKKNQWTDTAGYDLEYMATANQLTSVASGSTYGRGSVNLNDGAWHYVAATLNGSVAQVYVDGTNVTSTSAITPVVAGTQPLAIGRRSGGGDYFTGLIDEVRVSNVRRSDAWITTQRRSMVGTLITFH
jgi:PKD repeat protein